MAHRRASKNRYCATQYSKEPNNRDGLFTAGLRPPDPPNKSASGLHGNMDLGWEVSHFRGGRRPTYLGGLGGGASHEYPITIIRFLRVRQPRYRKWLHDGQQEGWQEPILNTSVRQPKYRRQGQDGPQESQQQPTPKQHPNRPQEKQVAEKTLQGGKQLLICL